MSSIIGDLGNKFVTQVLEEGKEKLIDHMKDVVEAPTLEPVKVGMANALIGWVQDKVIKPIKTSAFVQSRAVQITVMVLGVLLIAAGLTLLFVFHDQLGSNAFLFIIPAVIGLVKLLITSVCLGEECSLEKWKVFRQWAGLLEDQFDNGELDGSNKFFVDENRDERAADHAEGTSETTSGGGGALENILKLSGEIIDIVQDSSSENKQE